MRTQWAKPHILITTISVSAESVYMAVCLILFHSTCGHVGGHVLCILSSEPLILALLQKDNMTYICILPTTRLHVLTRQRTAEHA